MKSMLLPRFGSTKVASVYVAGVAMDGHGGDLAGIEPLSERSSDVLLDDTGRGAVPRVNNLANCTLAAIGAI